MKIFITGTTGFIGKNLIEYYKDHNVFEHKRYMDLPAKLDYFKPEVIINCAADIYKPDDMWIPNVVWVRDCLEYLKENSTTKMIQIGSSAEYGPMPRASNETDRINPVDMYQATKGAATLLCQGYARQYKLDVKIARVYSAYGHHEKPHRLFSRLYDAFFNNQAMTLYDGNHDFIYINDFIRGINMLINAGVKHGDIINFGSGIQYSNLEVLNLWEKITGKKAPVTYEDRMAKSFESEVWLCDTDYSKNVYGFKTEYSLEDGIRDLIKTKTAITTQENL
jgi:nucleoside-diphosphate-sugar epimerase